MEEDKDGSNESDDEEDELTVDFLSLGPPMVAVFDGDPPA